MPSSNRDVLQELQEILRQWEEDQAIASKDPTPQLAKLCELFERETINFLKKDPDPFDDRHPMTLEPECALGLILRALFRKDTFVTKLVNHYLRENYFTSQGLMQDSTELNIAACRLLLDILYGLDIPQVFEGSETTVICLFSWAESGPEPLRTYATGLLAAAMDVPEIAASFRDYNTHLVPLMLRRLWDLKDEGGGGEAVQGVEGGGGGGVGGGGGGEATSVPERPFAHLNKESLCSQTRPSHPTTNGEEATLSPPSPKKVKGTTTTTTITTSPTTTTTTTINNNNNNNNNNTVSPAATSTTTTTTVSTPTKNANSSGTFNIFGSPKSASKGTIGIGGEVSELLLNSDCSNSSWAEMGSYIVGTYQMYPVTRDTQQMFILKYLRPIGEYQESLGHVYEYHALELIIHYMQVRRVGNARLSFEGLRFLGSLLFHKKFCLEFVNMGGIQELLKVPRPSLPADGVALCLWYLAYCEEAVERICLLPERTVREVTCYALWLLECAHHSSRTHAVMFFGMVFRFRTLLDHFDKQDGLRKLLNLLSTLPLLQETWEPEHLENSASTDTMAWQTVKQVCLSLKQYFEAHLALKVQHLQRISSIHPQPSTPPYKAFNVSEEVVEASVEYLLAYLPARSHWRPVDNFLALKGLPLLLQLVAMVVSDSLTPKAETGVLALDILYVCSVLPAVQAALCDKTSIPLADEPVLDAEEAPGYAILVACILENVQSASSTSPAIQKAALRTLINCLCAPIPRGGSGALHMSTAGLHEAPALGSPSKRPRSTGEEEIKRAWDCVRTSNGIMYLLNMLHKRTPITDADCLRGLACRVLVGLSRSFAARQIMSKLPIFTSGKLQLLMKEPILQDKRAEHVKFQRHALDLIKAVSGGWEHTVGAAADVSMQSIHRADVVAQTKIHYNKKQLLQLIQSHLAAEGYDSVATALQQAAHLPPLPSHTAMGPPSRCLSATPSSSTRPAPSTATAASAGVGSNVSSPRAYQRSGGNVSRHLLIRVGDKTRQHHHHHHRHHQPPTTTALSQFGKSECGGAAWGGGGPGVVLEPSISLDTIVREYLTNQHANCINPVVTCPTFDLFQTDDQMVLVGTNKGMVGLYRKGGSPAPSTVGQHSSTSGQPLQDLLAVTHLTQYRPQFLGQEEGSYRVHEAAVTHLATHSSGSLVLTSSTISHEASLWGLDTMLLLLLLLLSLSIYLSIYLYFTLRNKNDHSIQKVVNSLDSCVCVCVCPRLILQDCTHADFSNAHDKIIGNSTQTARLYDLSTKQIISEFTPKLSNHYRINKAVLDPTDSLLLTDGALFDVRSGEQLHKFDKISPLLSGVFHRNGLEIISSSEIWDLRTFHLLRTVPALNECDVLFNRAGDVLFGVPLLDLLAYMYEDNVSSARPWETTSFRTLDATDYSSIATVNVKLILASMSVNHSDTQLAVVECDSDTEIQGGDIIDSQVRVYEVGMARQHDDDDDVLDEDDDDLGDEEDDSDSDDQNSQDDLDVDENELNSSEDIPFSSSSFDDDSNNSEAVYFQLSADALDNNQAESPRAEEEEEEEEEVDVEGDEDAEDDGEEGQEEEDEEEEDEVAEEEEEEGGDGDGDGGDGDEEEESGNASPTTDV
ncbi:protein mahjong-like [Scylla paramamosain]|uniref:protein mahjong-like n=1 Tax=Scylla paramamosain TaxID=85552 RepID=UPI003083A250